VVRIKKIRDSAKGQDCTVETPWCNHNPETVVFAHYGAPGEKGMGLKPDDTSGVYACSACHDALDGRNNNFRKDRDDDIRDWYWFRGMRRTWKLLVENGVLK